MPSVLRPNGCSDAVDHRIVYAYLYAFMQQSHSASTQHNFHSPLWYNKCLFSRSHHIIFLLLENSFEELNKAASNKFMVRTESELPASCTLGVFIDGLTAHYGVHSLRNNALRDNEPNCSWNNSYCKHKDNHRLTQCAITHSLFG